MRTLLVVLTAAAVLYLAACAALFFFQRSLIYFPHALPAVAGERMKLAAPGAEVLVTVRPRPGAAALVYFGGNAEDVSASAPQLAQAFPDRALYLMHYRGYGGSTGSPSEAALAADALALFDRVQSQHADVMVIGRSLGTGVATRLAAERPVSRLVLVTPFDSLQDLAAAQFPLFPVRWLLADKFESGRHAAQIRVPTVLLQAERDEVIPAWSTQKLHARFPAGIASLKVLPGTGHNTIGMHPLYLDLLRGAL